MNQHILTTPSCETYPILTGSGILPKVGAMLTERLKPCRVMIVTDSNVAPLYLETARKSFADAGFSVYTHTVPAGEDSKSVAEFGELLEAFA